MRPGGMCVLYVWARATGGVADRLALGVISEIWCVYCEYCEFSQGVRIRPVICCITVSFSCGQSGCTPAPSRRSYLTAGLDCATSARDNFTFGPCSRFGPWRFLASSTCGSRDCYESLRRLRQQILHQSRFLGGRAVQESLRIARDKPTRAGLDWASEREKIRKGYRVFHGNEIQTLIEPSVRALA